MRLFKDINSFSIGKKEINQYEISFFVFAEWKKGLQAATKITFVLHESLPHFPANFDKRQRFRRQRLRFDQIINYHYLSTLSEPAPLFASVANDGESHHRRSHDFLINDSFLCLIFYIFLFKSKKTRIKITSRV